MCVYFVHVRTLFTMIVFLAVNRCPIFFFNDSRSKLEPACVLCLQLKEACGALHQGAI